MPFPEAHAPFPLCPPCPCSAQPLRAGALRRALRVRAHPGALGALGGQLRQPMQGGQGEDEKRSTNEGWCLVVTPARVPRRAVLCLDAVHTCPDTGSSYMACTRPPRSPLSPMQMPCTPPPPPGRHGWAWGPCASLRRCGTIGTRLHSVPSLSAFQPGSQCRVQQLSRPFCRSRPGLTGW